MSGFFFDRSILHNLERPLSTDLNRVQSQLDRTLRDTLRQLLAQRISPVLDPGDDQMQASVGFIGDSFKVRPEIPASGSIRVSAGLGFAINPSPGSSLTATNPGVPVGGMDDLSLYSPLPLSSVVTFAVPDVPLPALTGRKDIIEVQVDRRSEDLQTRGIWDTILKKFTGTSVDKTYAWDLATRSGFPAGVGLRYKKGNTGAYADDDSFLAAGTVPDTAVDAGYVKVATINVRPGIAGPFDEDVIVDWRPLLFPGGVGHVGAEFSLNSTTNVLTWGCATAPPGVCVAGKQLAAGRQNVSLFVTAGNCALLRARPVLGNNHCYDTDYIYLAGAQVLAPTTATEVDLATQAVALAAVPNLRIGVGQRVFMISNWLHKVQVGVSPALSGTDTYAATRSYSVGAVLQRNGNP